MRIKVQGGTMGKYNSRATRLADALSLIEEGKSELDSLADEMESWRDNMEGTNLENTQKYETISECADTLRTGFDDVENALVELEGVEFPGMFG